MTASTQAIAEVILAQAWQSAVRLEGGELLDDREHVQRWDWQGEAMPLYPAFENIESIYGRNNHV